MDKGEELITYHLRRMTAAALEFTSAVARLYGIPLGQEYLLDSIAFHHLSEMAKAIDAWIAARQPPGEGEDGD